MKICVALVLFLFGPEMLLARTASVYEDVPQSMPGKYGSLKNVHCPIEIIPGKKIGDLELGRDIKEVEALGMVIKTVQGAKNSLIVGPYSVGLSEQGKLRLVEAEIGDLPHCVSFQGKKINPKMTAEQLSKVFSDCVLVDASKGGNMFTCDKISIGFGGWGGHQKTPSLKILSPAAF